ncbi:MAG TPA: methylenetetrahydrofolate--tRNA-(uracil(54)-C(5))-methyltransferase (FADH(2)-oxidizing) TrmFO [Bryobacteraceae bacterium]|nr:methylenetetrahydrofolate--tRNA-(uracil(54)-C(5))-methyltransferase (FADH(2)-oxidizing) TrmFO [Bryobacteraceae bacterium]
MPHPVAVLGAGLAGSEAAWQLASAGVPVNLFEMRPGRSTSAHQTSQMAELVCSNSLKSEAENSAPWQLKQELRRLGCLLMDAAAEARVPGGQALTVDRERFSEAVTAKVAQHPLVTLHRQEITAIPAEGIVIIATGPLTSDALAHDVGRATGADRLYFYDAISPIVEADSIDYSVAFRASRYGKSMDASDDYVNCPMNKDEYNAFIDALLDAAKYDPHIPEDNTPYFESCLPIEEIVRRGRDTLRFGPMKPVGLTDPRTGRWPYAAVQLRQENLRADSYNLVGFQNSLKFGEQARVLRLIPGLQDAKFVRFGQIHRNTYINAPTCLTPTLQLKSDPRIFFAGQISGVEGYVESIATGLMAGRHAADIINGIDPRPFPRQTALGSLCHYITGADPKNYQPANITFDLLPHLDEATRKRFKHDKKARHAEVCRLAGLALDEWLSVVA